MYKLNFEKVEEQEIELTAFIGSWRKQGSARNASTSASLTIYKAFHCVYHHILWKILKVMGVPDHLTCPLRNLYLGQEAKVKTRYGTNDWFNIGKGVCQGCILSLCLFNLYAEYIMLCMYVCISYII